MRSTVSYARQTAPLSIVELRVNYERPPFNQPEVRRALALAIDRQALVDSVLLGQGRPGVQGYPHPDSPWTRPGPLPAELLAGLDSHVSTECLMAGRERDRVDTLRIVASEPALAHA